MVDFISMGEYSRLTRLSGVFLLSRKTAVVYWHLSCEQYWSQHLWTKTKTQKLKSSSWILKTHFCLSHALKLFLRVLIGHVTDNMSSYFLCTFSLLSLFIYLFLSSFSFADGYLATLHVRLGGFWCSCSQWFPWIPWLSLPSPDTFSSVNRNIVSSSFLITCNESYCCFCLIISTHKRLKGTWL